MLNQGGDVEVRASAKQLLDFGSIPYSSHTNDFKNGIHKFTAKHLHKSNVDNAIKKIHGFKSGLISINRGGRIHLMILESSFTALHTTLVCEWHLRFFSQISSPHLTTCLLSVIFGRPCLPLPTTSKSNVLLNTSSLFLLQTCPY